MIKFLLRILVFAVIMVAVILVIELSLFLVPNELTYRKQYIHDNADRINTVVLGNSLTANAIVPEDISDSMFNCSLLGKPNYIDVELLKRLVEDLPGLDCIVFPIGLDLQYNALNDKDGLKNFRGSLLCRTHKYWGIPVEGQPRWKYLSELLWTKSSVLLRYFESDPIKCKPTGWEPAPPTKADILTLEEKEDTTFDYDSDRAIAARDNNIMHMREVARICRDNDIRLILVTTPYYSEDTAAVGRRGIDEMHYCAEKMIEVYPQAVYYDYMFDRDFSRDDFYDTSHLNEGGAHKFSKKIKPIFGRALMTE